MPDVKGHRVPEGDGEGSAPPPTVQYLVLMMEVRRLAPPERRWVGGDDGDQSGMRVQDCAELCGVMKRILTNG